MLVKSRMTIIVEKIESLKKSNKISGNTASLLFQNRVLNNGYHLMSFYHPSAVHRVLQTEGLASEFKLKKGNGISFYSGSKPYKPP